MIAINKETVIGLPIVMLLGLVWFGVNLTARVVETFNDIKALEISVNDLKREKVKLGNEIKDLRMHLEISTGERWTTSNMALWCAQAAIVNAPWQCVNPYFTINKDADVGSIAVWRTTVHAR